MLGASLRSALSACVPASRLARYQKCGVASDRNRGCGLCTNSFDPDKFKGPGGLTAREIMEKIKHSKARDGMATPHALTQAEIDGLSSKDLRNLLADRGLAVHDCFERADLIARAKSLL